MTAEKTEPARSASIDKGRCSVNLTALAQAAAAEHALTTLQAMRIYWRALLWCIFMSIGALMYGYDVQVRHHASPKSVIHTLTWSFSID